jgi:hypothetical protein
MNNLASHTKSFFSRNASTILTIVGSVGVVGTAVLAAKATPKALALVEEAKVEKGDELTTWETVKAAGPAYIPAVAAGAGTLMCVFGANVLNRHQQAAITSAYALINESYNQYKGKLKELYGEEAHNKIVDAIAVEKAEDVTVSNYNLTSYCDLSIADGTSEPRLFYDEYANRFFETTVEQVMNAEYHLNRNFVLRGYAYLNEFYEFLGLEPTDYGSKVGWSVDDDCIFWIDFNHRKTLLDNDTLEAVIIETPWGPSIEAMEDYQ